MIERTLPVTLRLTSKAGLDPRISALLAMEASVFNCSITLAHLGRLVNAKSVAEVMSLGAPQGGLIEIHAEGEQAQEAVNAVIALIQNH